MPSRFLTPLDTREIDEFGGIHQLLAPLVYESERLARTLVVPRDFKTDVASVPRLPMAYMMVGGKGHRAAVVHDWLYSGGIEISREEADQVLAEALQACGYGAVTRWLMYAGVRVGGASHFTAPNLEQEPHVQAEMWVA